MKVKFTFNLNLISLSLRRYMSALRQSLERLGGQPGGATDNQLRWLTASMALTQPNGAALAAGELGGEPPVVRRGSYFVNLRTLTLG